MTRLGGLHRRNKCRLAGNSVRSTGTTPVICLSAVRPDRTGGRSYQQSSEHQASTHPIYLGLKAFSTGRAELRSLLGRPGAVLLMSPIEPWQDCGRHRMY